MDREIDAVPASKRRDKQRRQARHAADAARQERRRAEEAQITALIAEVRERTAILWSAEHTVEEAAEQLALLFPEEEGRCLGTPLARHILDRGGVERLRGVTAAALARSPEGVVELQLAAQAVWLADEDAAKAAELYERAASLADAAARPGAQRQLAAMWLEAGRAAAAFDAVLPACAADPLDDEAQEILAEALHAAQLRFEDDGGSSREREVVGRFEDRSQLDDLRTALLDFVDAEDLRGHLAGHRERWWDESELGELPVRAEQLVEYRSHLERLADECALLLRPGSPVALGVESDAEAPEDEDPEEERQQSVLGRFAADPGTGADGARRAHDWLLNCRYGLWRVDDPLPAPGVWLVDLLSGRRVYAAFRKEQVPQISRRAVLLGMLVPVEGIWRTGDSFLAARPADGDELAEEVVWMADVVAEDLEAESAGGRRRRPRRARTRPAPSGISRSVVVDLDRPSSPAAADLYSKITAQLFPTLYGMVAARRLVAPRLTNTDGEPIVEVTAAVSVSDVDAAWQALSAHPDFEVEDESPAGGRPTIAWWGRRLTAAEEATFAAEAASRLSARGDDPAALDLTRPTRWLRGRLRRGDGELVVEVNSEGRLARALELLQELGTEPDVRRVDRRAGEDELRTHLAGVEFGSAGMPSQAAARAWAEGWLDEEIPLLGGLTPRRARESDLKTLQLEGWLRRLEHEADLAQRAGNIPPDVAWLRTELELDGELADVLGAGGDDGDG